MSRCSAWILSWATGWNSYDVWCNAKVVAAKGEGNGRMVKVHYMARFDEWVPVGTGRQGARRHGQAEAHASWAQSTPREPSEVSSQHIYYLPSVTQCPY